MKRKMNALSSKVLPLILIILIQLKLCNGLKILGVFPMNSRSHFVMSGRLMKELALRGHEVSVINQFPQKNQIPNYTDIIVKSRKQTFGINNIAYSDIKVFNTYRMDFFVKKAGTDICDLLGEPNMQEVLRMPKGYYDVIMVELVVHPCYIAFGRHLDAPVIGVVTTKLMDWLVEPLGNPLTPSYIPSMFASASQSMTFWGRLQNTLIMNSISYQINYYMEAQVEHVEKYFDRKLSSIQELYDDISLALTNSHYSLNDIRPTTPDIIEVGGLHVFDDEQQLTPELQNWLDKSTNGCILFTFGSMVRIETYPLEVIKIFYEAFEAIAPTRVIAKIANASQLPPGLPENVKTSPWLPQVAVLRHKNVKLFITHGGLMGIQEAIAHGVPMIGLPFYADQPMNLQGCVEKKIAIMLDLHGTLNTESLTNAITTILTNPTYRKNIKRASKLFLDRPMSASDTAVYWVEYVARHGKVLKSPATQLTWWQFHLIDVYGFILFCLLVALYIIKFIIGFLRKLVLLENMKFCKKTSKSTKTE